MTAPPSLPDALDESAWDAMDALTATDDYWDTLMPSHFASPTDLLDELARELDVRRSGDPPPSHEEDDHNQVQHQIVPQPQQQ